jgi:hypothetical protein
MESSVLALFNLSSPLEIRLQAEAAALLMAHMHVLI